MKTKQLSFFLNVSGFIEITNVFLCLVTLFSKIKIKNKYNTMYIYF